MKQYVTLRHRESGELLTDLRGDEPTYDPAARGWPDYDVLGEHDEWRDPEAEWVDGIGLCLPLAVCQRRKWDDVKAERDRLERYAPTRFGVADSDPESVGRITNLAVEAREARDAGEDYSETFTLADNSEVHFDTADDMIEFARAVSAHIKAVRANCRALRHTIDDATIDTIADVDPSSGWPQPSTRQRQLIQRLHKAREPQ